MGALRPEDGVRFVLSAIGVNFYNCLNFWPATQARCRCLRAMARKIVQDLGERGMPCPLRHVRSSRQEPLRQTSVYRDLGLALALWLLPAMGLPGLTGTPVARAQFS